MIVSEILFSFGRSFVSGSNTAIIYDSLIQLNIEDVFQSMQAKATLIFQFIAAVSIISGGYLYDFGGGKYPYFSRGLWTLLGVMTYYFMIEPKIDTLTFSIKKLLQPSKIGS